MNRKVMVGVMASAMFSMFGCSAEDAAAKVTAEPGKILVAYYSWGGNTRYAAQEVQKATGGTLFEIKPAKAYPTDYSACVDQAKVECRQGFKPELATKITDLAKYDVVFVGTPNWWGTMAPPVLTFLSENDFAGKTVVPFVTHGGGGVQRCESDMKKALPNAKFAKAGVFSGGSVRRAGDAIAKWVEGAVTVRK